MPTFAKTGTYFALHLIVAILLAYALSGSWQVALAIGLVEPAVQAVAFFFHERAWQRWGRGRPSSVTAAAKAAT